MLVGGMRVLAPTRPGRRGVLTERPGQLTNDFFVNLLELGNTWKPPPGSNDRSRPEDGGKASGPARRADLVFGSNSELRAVAEVYASDDAKEKFVHDFVKAWTKVMDNDRYDVKA